MTGSIKENLKGHVVVAFLLFGLTPLVKIGGMPGFGVPRFIMLAVVAACAVVGCAAAAVRREEARVRLTPMDGFFAVFYALYLISYMASVDAGVSFTAVLNEFVFPALYVLFRVLMSGSVAGSFCRAAALSAAFAALALSLWGQLQYFFDIDVPGSLKALFKTHHFPVIASLGNPNFLAEVLTLSLPSAAVFMNQSRRPSAAAVLIVLMGLTVFLTYSRLAWFVFLLLLSLLVLGAPVGKKKPAAAALGLVVALWAGFFTYHSVTGSTKTARVVKSFSLASGSPLLDRAVIYGSSLAMLRDAGFAGMGPGMFGQRYLEYQGDFIRGHPRGVDIKRLVDLDHAHSDVLETGIDSGYPAMAVYALLLGAGSLAGLRRFFRGKGREPADPFYLLPLGFTLFSLFAFPFFIPQSRLIFCLGFAFLAARRGRGVDLRAGRRLLACAALTTVLCFAWPYGRLMLSNFHYIRGLAFFGRDFDRAFDRFGRGIAAYPYNGLNYFSMGALLLNAGSPAGLRYMEESRRFMSSSSTALYLARGYRGHGRDEDARRWDRFIRRNRPDLLPRGAGEKEVIDGGRAGE
ncbi:MAG TPA: hypothetical protein ENN21_11560 [Spirochaetes bacterium]|nr:hypothetical protein [Spirochaetota bacterium]